MGEDLGDGGQFIQDLRNSIDKIDLVNKTPVSSEKTFAENAEIFVNGIMAYAYALNLRFNPLNDYLAKKRADQHNDDEELTFSNYTEIFRNDTRVMTFHLLKRKHEKISIFEIVELHDRIVKSVLKSDRWMRSEFAVQDQELRNLVERFSLYYKTSMSIVLPQLQELEKIRILVGAKHY